ncbi:hypothetical protein K502DRAFT_323711 [Neoconidiobolus thromboides FSU 785]|nr:hypothetical protein K502DRAFT_323711 [Neoconidiobolus thromboides FSU 785]
MLRNTARLTLRNRLRLTSLLSHSAQRNFSLSSVKLTETRNNIEKHEFKTETSKLLDIVANSLYSDKEVIIIELISNAADASEKLKHNELVNKESLELDDSQVQPEIEISLDSANNTFTIQDRGIGLTLEELHKNLGTIASSGSKKFIQDLKNEAGGDKDHKIIGQFGVGFYSGFMVSNKIEVFTRSALKGSIGYCWSSDGLNSYQISEVADLPVGTKIILHLKEKEFLDKEKVKSIIKKYSNFVSFPIKLEGDVINDVEPIWNKNAHQITQEEHDAFYQSITKKMDKPYYSLAYKTDAPISIKSVFYIPEKNNNLFNNEMNEAGVTLYSRNVMISNKTHLLLPHWLRFVQGVVDSEDIPLNLSREMLQKGALINKLKSILSTKIIKWLKDEAKRDGAKFNQFYLSFNRYFKEAVILEEFSQYRSDVIPLLRFYSSHADDLIQFSDYKQRMKPDQKSIYYSCSNKSEALSNPYYEPYKKNDIEVLFLNDQVDKVLADVTREYEGIPLVDIESTVGNEEIAKFDTTPAQDEGLKQEDFNELRTFIIEKLGAKLAVSKIEVAKTSTSYPALAVGHQYDKDPYMREVLKQSLAPGQEMPLVPITIQMSKQHSIVIGLAELIKSDPTLAEAISEQIINNARVVAGLSDDIKPMMSKLNLLIEQLVQLKVKQ